MSTTSERQLREAAIFIAIVRGFIERFWDDQGEAWVRITQRGLNQLDWERGREGGD